MQRLKSNYFMTMVLFFKVIKRQPECTFIISDIIDKFMVKIHVPTDIPNLKVMYHLSIKPIDQVSNQIKFWIKPSFHSSDIDITIFRKHFQVHLKNYFAKYRVG